MAPGNFELLKFIRLLILVFIALPVVSTNVDCGGKAFHCVNTTHFKICVDLGGGVSQTIDSFIIPCPVSTECRKTNRYECEFPKPVILETVSATSVPHELSPVTAATTVSPDTSGLTPTEFLQSVTGTSESSKTELYKITTDISEVGKSFKLPASNSEQGTTEYSQTLINTNTSTDTELIEVPIGTSVTNTMIKTELYQTSNQTGLKNKTKISNNLTNIINTSEFSQGLTDFTTLATTEILENFSGTSRKKPKHSQVLDIQSEVTQDLVEMSAPITTEIFQNLKDKIVLNKTETFKVSKNTSVTNNIGYKQDPTEASESIITETTKLTKQTSLTNESEFYQEPVFISNVPSTTETLKGSTSTSVTSNSDFSQSYNGINELIKAEMLQTSTDGIIPNETELFESSTISRVLKKSDIFQGPDEISAIITTESFQSSSVANEPYKTELFETSTDSKVLNTSENYNQGPDRIIEHEMLQTSTNAPNKPEILETLTDSRILNTSDMFQESDSINAPFTTKISKNSTVANELNKTELLESLTDSTVSNENIFFQGPDNTRAMITAKKIKTTTNASVLNKTDLFEVSTDANVYETVTNQPDLFKSVLDTRSPITTKDSQTISDTNEHFVLLSNSSGTSTQSSKDTVSNKSVVHQGYLEITTPFEVNDLKTSIESNILNITEIFQAPVENNFFTTTKLFQAETNLTTFKTTESPQAAMPRLDKNYTATFSLSSEAPLKVTHPSIVTTEQGVENQIEWSKVTSTIDNTKENHSIIDSNSHTALATEDSNSNNLSIQNITIKVNNIFLVTKNISSEYENSTAINSFVGVKTVESNSNNFVQEKLSNGHNELLLSLNKEHTSDATESDNLINRISNPNDLGIMASSNSLIDSTTYDTTESHLTTLSSQEFTTETVLNKNNEAKVIEVSGYTFDVNTFAVLTPPTVTIQDYSYYNTELQDFLSITTENSATSNNDFVSDKTIKTTVLNDTNLEAIYKKNESADEINTSSVNVSNKEPVNFLDATDPPYKVFTPVIHNSVTTQDWAAVDINPQLEITANTITSFELNSRDHVESNLNTPEAYLNISKGLHESINVIEDLFSKNTSKINVSEVSENSTQTRNMNTEQIAYLRNVSTLPPTDVQIKSTDAAKENSTFKAVKSAVTIVKELTQPQNLSQAAKNEFQTPSSLVANSFDLEQIGSINSIAATNADHNNYFVTESNLVEYTTTDAATEATIFKAEESAATIVKEMTQPQKLSPTRSSLVATGFGLEQTSVDYKKIFVTESNIVELKTIDAATDTNIFKAVESDATIVQGLTQPQKLSPTSGNFVANDFGLEQTGSINYITEASEDYKKHVVTKSNIVESKPTEANTDTSIFKAIETAATVIKDLTQPQKLSPTPSSLVDNSFDLEQIGSINSIAKTNADHNKYFVTESNIVESTKTDAATETTIFKAEESAATIVKEMTQPQKLSPTRSSLVATGFGLEQTNVDYKNHFVTESNIVESKPTDATTDTSIFKAVETAATVIRDLTKPQKLSPTPSSLVDNSFDLEQIGSINSIAKTNADHNKYFVTESNIVESTTTDAATETTIFKAEESAATIVKEMTQSQKLSPTRSSLEATGFGLEQTSVDYKRKFVTESNIVKLKTIDAATETNIFKAVESDATIVQGLTQPQKLSPTSSNFVANDFGLEQTSSINSIAKTSVDYKEHFVTESNIVESKTTDAATETNTFKAVESAATIGTDLIQPQKLYLTFNNLEANGWGLEQTSSINSFAETPEDYKKHVVTKSNIVELTTTDAATETSIFKAEESAAFFVKELTQPQKLSPTRLVANGFGLEQTSSINSIVKTSVDYKEHFVTESNIVESKTTDAATETNTFKAVESAATIGTDLIQPQKLYPTFNNLEANGWGLEQTSSINSFAETPEDYKKHVVTKSNIVESKTTDATTDTSILKAVESAATVIKELTQPQKLSLTPSSLVANGFDLEQTGSINTITESTLDYKEIVVKESNIMESTTYINYLDNTESNLGNGQKFLTEITKKTTPFGADLQHSTEQISAALNIPEIAFPPIHEQKNLNRKDIDLQIKINGQHSPSETSIKEQSTLQRAMNTLDKQTTPVNQDVTTVHNLNINNIQFGVTSEPFFTVSDTQVGVIPISTNSTKNVSSIAHSLINHIDIPTSSNTYYSEAKTRNVDNDGSRILLELPENTLNKSKYNVIQSTLNSLLNNTIREPTVDLVNKLEGFKNTTDDQGLGANKAVTSEVDLKINSTSLIVTGVSKDKASKTYPSESTTKHGDFINTSPRLNKGLVLQSKVHVNGSKDTKKDNLSQTELNNYNEIAKSVILKNDTLKRNVRGSTYPHNTTYVSDIKTFETPNNKPYAVEVKVKSFINSNSYIKTNPTHNLSGSTNEVLDPGRTQISNIPKAKTNDVLNKPISLLLNVSKNFALPNKSVTERIQISANGNYTNSEKYQTLAAHNEHINTTVRSMNETKYNKPENKSEQKEDKLLLTNDEHNESQIKGRNLTVSRALESASQLKNEHSVIPSDKNIKGSSVPPLIGGRQKVSTQINPKRPVITIPKHIGAAQATSVEKDIAHVNQTQRTVLTNVNNNFTSTIARKTRKIIRTHATINNEKIIISFNCRNRNRGRYSDPDDCNKFYICIGKREPIIGRCPVNTVFSELKKQCTNNMSHCVRGSEFKCTAEGRFIDIFKHNVYYICLKSNQHFIRYKFQCQKGYYLNKTLVKCIEESELEMQSQTSISNDNSKSEVSNNEDNKSNKDISKSRHSHKSGEEFECEEEGKFADGNDCRRYYVCKKNRKSEFRRRKKKCDSDELFHKDRKKCVDAESYEC